ncbi:MAG: hypothetical protein KF870_07300 [Leadbetterella sp.]|nr:hypothetical protein [Leadbetterella sp.]
MSKKKKIESEDTPFEMEEVKFEFEEMEMPVIEIDTTNIPEFPVIDMDVSVWVSPEQKADAVSLFAQWIVGYDGSEDE